MDARIFLSAIACLLSQAITAEQRADVFDLSLSELVRLEVDVAGYAVQNVGLLQIPSTNNPFALPLQVLPSSVQIVNHKSIEARNLHNVVEVVADIPGVITGESPSEPYSFSIRGFTRDSVEVLFDGVSLGRSTLNMRPLGSNNLEQVEVFMGPTLRHGDGSAGGTINIVPRKPQIGQPDISRLLISYGRFDSTSQNVDVSGSPQDNLALRFNIDHRTSEGWVDASESESLNSSLSAVLRLQPHIDWRASLNYFKDELPGYWGTPLLPRSMARDPVDVVDSASGLVVDKQARYTNYNVADDVIDSEAYLLKTGLAWTPNDRLHLHASVYDYTAVRRWRNAENFSFNTTTGQVDRERLLVDHDRDMWGAKAGIDKQFLLIGRNNQFNLDIEYKDTNFRRTLGFTANDSVDADRPDPGNFYAAPLQKRDDTYRQKTLALIADNRFLLSERWALIAGVRQEHINFNRQSYNVDGSDRSDNKGSVDLTSIEAGMTYQVTDRRTLYSNYTRQYDSLAGNLFMYSSDRDSQFRPADIEQWELGYKSGLQDNRGEFTVAVYSIDYRRKAMGDSDLVTNEQRSEGLELTSRFALTNNLHASLVLAYINAELEDFYDVDYSRDVSGHTPINVPEKTASLWLSYDRLAGLPLEIGANIHHVSARFADSANSISLDGYTLYNAFAAYTKNNYRVSLQFRNITDELYVPWSDLFYPNQVLLGAPRSIECSFRIAF